MIIVLIIVLNDSLFMNIILEVEGPGQLNVDVDEERSVV